MRSTPLRTMLMVVPLLLVAACGTQAPPAPVSPMTSSLTAAPFGAAKPARAKSPWAGSRLFGPKPPAPTPLFSRPRRPARGPSIPTLRS
ncbi:MAG TPA: hypothetical protein VGP07_21070 [Polyangia bacterium]|jgi:hypothetical protein